MKRNRRVNLRWATVAAISFVWAAFPVAVRAQVPSNCSPYPGDKVVYQGSTTTTTHDYIDASQLVSSTSPTDVCYAISQGLTNLVNLPTNTCATPAYATRGVIDARGVASTGGTFACATNPFQDNFYKDSQGHNLTWNVTVLLPAGIIPIGSSWYLPSNTRLIGEGSFNTSTLPGSVTTNNVTELQASGTWSSGSAMIYMGDQFGDTVQLCGNHDCNGISIEHLGLDATGITAAISGIYNTSAQELSYVNDVSLTNMTGTGLVILGNTTYGANNSGPYTNIFYSGTGSCLDIYGTNNTRGVNGLHCKWTGTGTAAVAAAYLDGSNNLIQNVSLAGYNGTDGIAIGSQATSTLLAPNNVLVNIMGPSTVANVVDIYNTAGAPTDLTLMGISGGKTTGFAINDQVTGSTIPHTSSSTGVGLYILGEAVTAGTSTGYSRFTTSSSLPTWFQGTGIPASTGTLSTCTANGSLYSVTPTTSGVSGSTLWGCVTGKWYALSNGK